MLHSIFSEGLSFWLLLIIIFIVLPFLYFKFVQEMEDGNGVSAVKGLFIVIMHILGWPLLIVFILIVTSVISYVAIPLLILFIIYCLLKKD